MKITAHMLIKNEENWVWFAISSVLPHVSELLIFDTGSTDKTLEIIDSLVTSLDKKDRKKIRIFNREAPTRADLVALRQEMVELTQTEWFMLVDGDEVWSDKSLDLVLKTLSVVDDETFGVVVRTRNCVGDIFHYQPESAGEYQLLGKKGHLSTRFYRKSPHYQWRGEYPLEGYMDSNGVLINDQEDHLLFVNTYYYHLTHLKRSDQVNSAHVIDRLKKYKYEIGVAAYDDEIPAVFNRKPPQNVPDPFTTYSFPEKIVAHILTPIKRIKRGLKKVS